MTTHLVDLDTNQIGAFCKRWNIERLSLFGSVLGAGFHAQSDLDVLIEVDSRFLDHFDPFLAEEQLASIVRRKVDLVQTRHLKWVVRDRILSQAQVIYEA